MKASRFAVVPTALVALAACAAACAENGYLIDDGGSGDAESGADAGDAATNDGGDARTADADASEGRVISAGGDAAPRPDGSPPDSASDGSLQDASPQDGAPDGPPCQDACTEGLTQCASGAVQTCERPAGGCAEWVTTTTCGSHQSCTSAAGPAACTCNVDPVCSAAGATCADPSTLATCVQDMENGQTCFYESPSTTACTNGACSAGACCTNTCTSGTYACLATSSTQIGSCETGANGCTAETASACGSDLVCERAGGAACVDPNWADWPMPNAQVDVTAGAPNLESYTDNGDGTVTDNVTGLVWQQAVPSGTYTQTSALAYCAGLSLAGFTDWRLPSLVELVSLVDLGNYNPSVNGTYFEGTPTYFFWSSTPYAGNPSVDAWTVDFGVGSVGSDGVTNTNDVRCVR